MTPPARLAAAIEILDSVLASRETAEETVRRWGRAHRFAGSKDRRAIADHVFAALRARALAEWVFGAATGRGLLIASLLPDLETVEGLFTGEGHAPEPLAAAERTGLLSQIQDAPDWARAGVPAWLASRFADRFGDSWTQEAAAAALVRAPIDLRVNTLRGPVDKALNLLAQDDVRPDRTALSALGLRLPAGYERDVQSLRAFASGWIEVQDEASQVAAALLGAAPGAVVVDYCAGGGGKTLAFAAAMGGSGRLVSCDVDRRRLTALQERAARAGAQAEILVLGPHGEGAETLDAQADYVFVDAPCSGSGTWRRHPEAAWRLTPETLERLSRLQARILDRAAQLVRPGGRLAYATCSMLGEENEAPVEAFLALHEEFRPLPVVQAACTPGLTSFGRERVAALAHGGHTLQLTPKNAGTDGFFTALFERRP